MSIFSSHNVLLPDGRMTIPGQELLEHSQRLKTAMLLLKTLVPGGLAGKSIVDIGCLEGGYSLEFAKAGMDVTGIEVRESNYDNCIVLEEAFGLPNLRFVRDDCRNLAEYGVFDVCFCYGLLYHLDRPREYIELLARQTRSVVLINTLIAPESDSEYSNRHFKLSRMTEHDRLPGRWFVEYDAKADARQRTLRWASWGNSRSFWPTRAGILQALKDAGFSLVLEDVVSAEGDVLEAMRKGQPGFGVRPTFIGIKAV